MSIETLRLETSHLLLRPTRPDDFDAWAAFDGCDIEVWGQTREEWRRLRASPGIA